jgi:Zn-dependent protease with chaperone function
MSYPGSDEFYPGSAMSYPGSDERYPGSGECSPGGEERRERGDHRGERGVRFVDRLEASEASLEEQDVDGEVLFASATQHPIAGAKAFSAPIAFPRRADRLLASRSSYSVAPSSVPASLRLTPPSETPPSGKPVEQKNRLMATSYSLPVVYAVQIANFGLFTLQTLGPRCRSASDERVVVRTGCAGVSTRPYKTECITPARTACAMGPAATAMLPPLVRGGFLLHWAVAVVAAFLLTAIPCAVLFARAHFDAPNMHWTEKARRFAPITAMLAVSYIAIPLLVGAISYNWCGEASLIVPKFDALGAMIGALIGSWIAACGVRRRLRRIHDHLEPVRAVVSFQWTLTLVSSLASYVIVIWGQPPSLTGALMVDAAALALLTLSFLRPLGILRCVGVARRAGADVERAVNAAANRIRCPAPTVYLLDASAANAVAFTFEGAIAFTTGAVRILNVDEMVAIAAHEIAHMRERRSSHWLRLVTPAAILLYLAIVARRPDFRAVFVGFLLIVGVASRATKRTRALEKRADQWGADHEPQVLEHTPVPSSESMKRISDLR